MLNLPDALRQAIRSRLLSWASTSLRDLPWRRERDPYRVWVSEIMLQQTRVETVIPYYERWIVRFPTIDALARADLGEALKCWEGLGYYARCRHLHRAAQVVLRDHGGQLPDDRDALLALPGIGPNTVGAILSLVFGQDAALLDGNVRRVLSRLMALDSDPKAAQTRKTLWSWAESLTPPGEAGQFNEAIMDLGATICTPRRPLCAECPFLEVCQAYASGDPESYPPPLRREPTPHYDVAAGVIWKGESVLIAQRPLDGLLGGLWEFPGGKREAGETLTQCLERELCEEMDIQVAVGKQLIAIKHAFTHFRVTVYAFECRYRSAHDPQTIGVNDWRWARLEDLDRYPFSVVDQKIIGALHASRQKEAQGVKT